MSQNYIVSAQKPTVVSCVATGALTDPGDLNLLIGKTNRIEIFLVCPEGLKPVLEVPINGRILSFRLFKPPGSEKDLLFLLTAKFQAAILEYMPGDEGGVGRLETRAHGNIADRVGRAADTGVLIDVDPEHHLIALRLYEGVLKVIQYEANSRELKAFNLRFTDINVIDLVFLQGVDKPTIAYIYQDNNGRHVKTQELGLVEKEFSAGPWSRDNVESEAALLIRLPGPYSGVVVVGQESLTYFNGGDNEYVSTAPPFLASSSIVCYAPVDENGARFLLGDVSGRLLMLLLDLSDPDDDEKPGQVLDLRVEMLGDTTIPECLTYLDNGYVFVGSRLGDSQLVHLNEEPISPDEPTNFIEVKDSFTNLGPIVDMAVVDLERQGQGQVITCSGAYKEGSLRIIRNGIGINELATVDLPGIKGMWSLRWDCSEQLDNLIVLSFVGYSKTLLFTGEETEETEIPGFDDEEQTIWAGNIGSRLLQVTGKEARLIGASGSGVVSRYSVDGGMRRINLAAVNSLTGQAVIIAGKDIFYLEVSESEIKEVRQHSLNFEIACVDMSPVGTSERSELLAVGLWSEISVRLLTLPELRELISEPLGGEMIPRSVLMASFEAQLYLLVALGDGSLSYYLLNKTTGTHHHLGAAADFAGAARADQRAAGRRDDSP